MAGVLVGVVLIVVGCVAHLGQSLVGEHLVRPEIYSSALADSAAYRRLYSEVLTDPQVRDATDQLLGEFSFGGRDLADTVALSNALLRMALPPVTVRQLVEQLIGHALDYVRGDVDRLDTSLDVAVVLRGLDTTGDIVVRSVLANVTTEVLDGLPEFTRALRSFADELADGRIPASVPVVGGRAVTTDEVLAVLDGYPLPATVRGQAEAALRSGDAREAVIVAAAAFARRHLAVLSTTLDAGGALRIDPLRLVVSGGAGPETQVVDQLDTVRAGVRFVPWWSRWVSLAVVAVGAGLVVVALRRRFLLAVAVVGAALVAAAVVFAATWWLVARRLDSPLATLASSRSSPAVPASVAGILQDVDRSLSHQLAAVRDDDVRWLLVFGAGLLGVALVGAVAQRIRRRGVLPAIAALWVASIVAGGWIVTDAGPGTAGRVCNGHAELCDRSYDTVVQAATHNSMSSPGVVQIWPDHDADIAAQLDAGVRTLLIDTKYWPAIATPSALSTAEQVLSPELQASLFATLGQRLAAHPGAYLCHSRCAYGAIPFTAALQGIGAFLDDNPDEVVTLIIENGITTADTAAAFEAGGIAHYLFDGSTADGWPTLGQLIDRGQRLVVFAESAGPPPPWYRSYVDDVQDTEYHVTSIDQLSCDRKRGSPTAPLFLLNHWIEREAPDRADAVTMNQRAFIVERSRACAARRGRLPNFVAVDFFSIGDVVGAVDELNGVSP